MAMNAPRTHSPQRPPLPRAAPGALAGAARARPAAVPSRLAAAAPPAVRLATRVAAPTPGNLPPQVMQLVASPGLGEPLPLSVRRTLERSFDIDLRLVRVHPNVPAADSIGARAFTYGLHIFLGSGESPTDLALLAHEVTHVVQQQGAPVFQMYSAAGSDRFEHEAEHAGAAAQRGAPAAVQERTGGPRVQKQGLLDRGEAFLRAEAMSLLEEHAPELVPILRQGVIEWLKEKLGGALRAMMDEMARPVRTIGDLVATLRRHFGNLVTWLRDAGAKIARGDCSSIAEAAEKIHQVFEALAAPVVERVQHYANIVKQFFQGLWDRFGAPVWNLLQRIGGAIWEQIQRVGRWIWEKTKPIRDYLSSAWRWFKNWLGIGEGEEGQNGILQWFQRKAGEAWEWVSARLAPYKRQILIAVAVLVMLSPAGQIVAIVAAAAGIARGIQWLRQNMRNRGSIVQGRGLLRGVILPAILGAIGRVSAIVGGIATSITGVLNRVVNSLGEMAATVNSIPILSFAGGLVTFLADAFRGLLNWAVEGVQGLASWLQSGLQRLGGFARMLTGFLERIGAAVANVGRLVYELGGRVWNAIPACIRDPFIDFFIPLILKQIPFFSELVATPEAWQKTRAQVMGLIRQVFRDFDLIGAMKSVFRLIGRALPIPGELVTQVLEKGAQAFDLVVAAPLRFIESSLKAILLGVGLFMRGFLSHLWYGVQGWLLNAMKKAGTGVQPPATWDLPGLFGFVLDVLGISVDHVLDLLKKRIPGLPVARLRTIIRVLTGVWEWVKIAIEEGPAGLWRKVTDSLGNLGQMVLESAVGWVMQRIFVIVSARLTALAASAGLSAVLEAVVAVYQAIKTAFEYAPRILEIILKVFETVGELARGVTGTAAQGVVSGLRMAMPVVIGFLANYAGLGGIGERIREIILDIRERVDKAILALIDKGMQALNSLLSMLGMGGDAQQRLDAALTDAQAAVNRFAGKRVGAVILRPLLGLIKLRYRLTSLDVVPNGQKWAVRGVANPTGQKDTEAETEDAAQFIYQTTASGGQTIGVRKDLTVVRFPPEVTLTGNNAQQVLQKALESIVPRVNVSYPSTSLARAAGPQGHVQGVKDGQERESLPGGMQGYQPGDHRGHLIGDRFYGQAVATNIVPMHPSLNLSTFKSYENTLATRFKTHRDAGKAVLLFMHIVPTYLLSDPSIPLSFRPTTITASSKVITLKAGGPDLDKEESEINDNFDNPPAVINDFNINTAPPSTFIALGLNPRLQEAILAERSRGRFRPQRDPYTNQDTPILEVIKLRLFPVLGTYSNLLGQLDAIESKIKY